MRAANIVSKVCYNIADACAHTFHPACIAAAAAATATSMFAVLMNGKVEQCGGNVCENGPRVHDACTRAERTERAQWDDETCAHSNAADFIAFAVLLLCSAIASVTCARAHNTTLNAELAKRNNPLKSSPSVVV